jgi:hypothetical protein
MKRLPYRWSKIICCSGMAMVLSGLVTGCEEANVAIDNILGRRTPVLSAASQASSPQTLIPAMKRTPGEGIPPVTTGAGGQSAQTPHRGEDLKPTGDEGQQDTGRDQLTPRQGRPAEARPAGEAGKQAVPSLAQGKRRAPGTRPPVAGTEEKHPPFVAPRDPFKMPTEVLPTDCPPSMPLCKFDRSQLKLVGVIQVSEGNYKGLVEDPDGRGYFITTGMQIGGATVTQVTSKGITLHLHKTRTDVTMPLFREARDTGE